GDADNGDKNQKQQKGEDDLLPQRPPPCGVALQFAERRADMCARRERNRVDARLTHRLPPKRICLLLRSSKHWRTRRNTERRFCQAKTSAVSENNSTFCLRLPAVLRWDHFNVFRATP